MTRMTMLLLGLGLLAGCTGGEEDDTDDDQGYEITDQDLQGVINGTSWTFGQGQTNSFLSDEEDYFGELYSSAFESCGFSDPGAPMLLASIPTTPGTYQLGLSQNMTFVPSPGENLIATTGTLRVDTITETTVTGAVFVTYDGDNEIDGNFELTICTE